MAFSLVVLKPYLKAININGMKADGPQILPVGRVKVNWKCSRPSKLQGTMVLPIGILGHIAGKDVKKVLEGNLEGLEKLLGKMGESEALSTY